MSLPPPHPNGHRYALLLLFRPLLCARSPCSIYVLSSVCVSLLPHVRDVMLTSVRRQLPVGSVATICSVVASPPFVTPFCTPLIYVYSTAFGRSSTGRKPLVSPLGQTSCPPHPRATSPFTQPAFDAQSLSWNAIFTSGQWVPGVLDKRINDFSCTFHPTSTSPQVLEGAFPSRRFRDLSAFSEVACVVSCD